MIKSDLMRIVIPGKVWDDCLNPLATEMESAIGLTHIETVRRGRGTSHIYEATPEQARDLAEYMWNRASDFLAQGVIDPYDIMEKRERAMLSQTRKIAEAILEELGS